MSWIWLFILSISFYPTRNICNKNCIAFWYIEACKQWLLFSNRQTFLYSDSNSLLFVSQGLFGNMSGLVQKWLGSEQATQHYLNKWWPSSLMPYGITRPKQWVCSYTHLAWTPQNILIITFLSVRPNHCPNTHKVKAVSITLELHELLIDTINYIKNHKLHALYHIIQPHSPNNALSGYLYYQY